MFVIASLLLLSAEARRGLREVLRRQRGLRRAGGGLATVRLAVEGPGEVVVVTEHRPEPTAEQYVARHGPLSEGPPVGVRVWRGLSCPWWAAVGVGL